jgi:hypothetical protein
LSIEGPYGKINNCLKHYVNAIIRSYNVIERGPK